MFRLLRDYLARHKIEAVFGSLLFPTAADRPVKPGPSSQLSGREAEITPLFANLRGYVGIAEQVPLARLPELMNAYFEACTSAIEHQAGTIDKFIGDVVVAMFGAPTALPDHALRGCLAALQIQTHVAAVRTRLQAEGEAWPPLARQLRVSIGLHSGVATIGNLGSGTRFNYTMMGDNVNLAARLESIAKIYGVWTLCSSATREACECLAPGKILFRSLGRIIVVGRAAPLEIFEPLALTKDADERAHNCVGAFHAALARFRAQDWPGAIEGFDVSAPLERDRPAPAQGIVTNPSLIFRAMAEGFAADPKKIPFVL